MALTPPVAICLGPPKIVQVHTRFHNQRGISKIRLDVLNIIKVRKQAYIYWAHTLAIPSLINRGPHSGKGVNCLEKRKIKKWK